MGLPLVNLETVLSYHERTKHHPQRYARSLGFLDWDTQPDPFRRYPGAARFPLEMPQEGGPIYDELFEKLPEARQFERASISALFFDSFALSAWKSSGRNRWPLRVNPSSGNLHPTEAYLIAGPTAGFHNTPALYHYAPLDHVLELRGEFAAQTWNDLSSPFPVGVVFLGLTSIAWRESWKYGERAFRYCQHDVGHALGAICLAAAIEGWCCTMVDSLGDDVLARLLGVDGQSGAEREHPEVLIAIHEPPASGATVQDRPGLGVDAVLLSLRGEENQLSSTHHSWPVIDDVLRATHRTFPVVSGGALPLRAKLPRPRLHAARKLIRQRRSAVALDGNTSIEREAFFELISRTMPSVRTLAWGMSPEVHLMLLIHRVKGIDPGLYFLIRNQDHKKLLHESLDPSFLWGSVEGCPQDLPLWMLRLGDVRDLAREMSCHQDIACDGAFAVAMVARFRQSLEEKGPWLYRRLFWETGMIGQMLYLEAEAAGLRGTGIGCFFDDEVHRLLGLSNHGLSNDAFQSLYHFTVGGALEDARIETLPAY